MPGLCFGRVDKNHLESTSPNRYRRRVTPKVFTTENRGRILSNDYRRMIERKFGRTLLDSSFLTEEQTSRAAAA